MDKFVLTSPDPSYMSQLLDHELLTTERERSLLIEKCRLQHELEHNAGGYTEAGRLKLEAKLNRTMNELVNHNYRLVASVSSRFRSQHLSFIDLFQEGCLGLIRGVQKFDASRTDKQGNPLKLSTYATWWIEQAVRRAFQNNNSLIRKPVHFWDSTIAPVYRTLEEFKKLNGVRPTNEELAEITGISVDKVDQVLQHLRPVFCLDEPTGADGDVLGDFIKDDAVEDVDYQATHNQLAERLEQIVDSLSIREGKVIQMRFGLNGYNPHTLEEVGNRYGVTRERIRQIEVDAMRKLRHPSRSRRLRDFAL